MYQFLSRILQKKKKLNCDSLIIAVITILAMW